MTSNVPELASRAENAWGLKTIRAVLRVISLLRLLLVVHIHTLLLVIHIHTLLVLKGV